MCEKKSLGRVRDKREWGLVTTSEGELTLPSFYSLGPSGEWGSGQEQMGTVGGGGEGEPVQSPDTNPVLNH